MDKDEIAEGVNDIRSPICAEAFVEAEQSLTLTQLTLDDADKEQGVISRSDDPQKPDLIAVTRRKSLQLQNKPVASIDPTVRKHGDEVPTSPQWTQHKKHFFILSSAGKPIYSRYGDESKLSSFMGLIQAILSFFASDDDTVRCLKAGSHTFVFSVKGPLYLVSVSSTGESEAQLRGQLDYLYAQILFILTSAQLTRIFETRVNYDLRNLLSGTEMFLDHLSGAFRRTPGFFLEAVQCLRMSGKLRHKIGNILASGTPKSVVFGMLLAKEKLVTMIRPKRYSLHPADLHLIINMICSSSGFRSVETWTPICLPRFNNRAFLHAYVCFLGADLCLVLASTDREGFFEVSEYKQNIVKGLEESGCVGAIDAAIKGDSYTIVEVEVPTLRHFMYKSIPLVQFTQPGTSPPYTRKEDWRRLMKAYQYACEKMRAKENGARVVYHTSTAESVVCCQTSAYELYACFGPLVSKTAVMEAISRLQKWIKKQEDTIFISKAPVI